MITFFTLKTFGGKTKSYTKYYPRQVIGAFYYVKPPRICMYIGEAIQVLYFRESQQLRTLVLVLKSEIRSKEFSFSSLSLRTKLINLDDRDQRRFFLDLVSKPEIKCQKIVVLSQCARLNRKNSHSRLEVEKVTLVDL